MPPSHSLLIYARTRAPARVYKYGRFFLKSPAFLRFFFCLSHLFHRKALPSYRKTRHMLNIPWQDLFPEGDISVITGGREPTTNREQRESLLSLCRGAKEEKPRSGLSVPSDISNKALCSLKGSPLSSISVTRGHSSRVLAWQATYPRVCSLVATRGYHRGNLSEVCNSATQRTATENSTCPKKDISVITGVTNR